MKKRLICLTALALCMLLAAQVFCAILPAFAEEAPVADENNKASSVTYTPSEDGKTMTISYLLNGETVS